MPDEKVEENKIEIEAKTNEENSRRARKDKLLELKQRITTANQLFVRNDFNTCISTLKSILVEAPKNANAYFMLGLVFEEMKDDIKAYNFYLIASQLMKTNYALWGKLYDLSTKMNLYSDKLYFIQKLQKNSNKKELVDEKMELYKMLKAKYRILETKIELFYFDGVDFEIFDIIRNETKHKYMTARCAMLLIKYYKKYPEKCGTDFLMNIIRLQYDTGYLYGTRNLIEKYLLGTVDLPRDIRIIYIICVLANSDLPDITETTEEPKNIADIEFRESLFEAKESIFAGLNYNNDLIFDIYSEKKELRKQDNNFDIYDENTELEFENDNFDIYDENTKLKFEESQFGFATQPFTFDQELNLPTQDNFEIPDINLFTQPNYDQFNVSNAYNEGSKTLNLNELLADKNPHAKISDLDALINDKLFWENFQETEHVKGLLGVLQNLKLESFYLRILRILEEKVEHMKEFVCISFGNYFFDKTDYNNSLDYYRKTLEINSDNNYVKSKLYEIYKKSGNIELANKFCTISSLVNFVDDLKNEEKSNFMLSTEKCNENRNLYAKSRILFKENMDEYFELVKPLVEDFSENRFLFTKHKKFNLVGEDNNDEETALVVASSEDSTEQFNHNTRFLSLHGLNANEWSAVILEFIIANITQGNLKEATTLLKKSLDCEIFKRRTDIYLQIIFMTIKHAVLCNDLSLLSSCFKKAFYIFKDYSWANFYFYLLNFFPDYIIKMSYGRMVRNIRRVFTRNHLFVKDTGEGGTSSTIYRSIDLNLLLGSFFVKNIARKSYKIINNIILTDNFRDKMTYFIILIITYKSRRNETKNEMLKKGLDGLRNLVGKCTTEENCNLSYNIGIAYHMLGYIGFAEKNFKEALKSKNIELRRMARLSLMIIYRNSNIHLYKKLYDEDETA